MNDYYLLSLGTAILYITLRVTTYDTMPEYLCAATQKDLATIRKIYLYGLSLSVIVQDISEVAIATKMIMNPQDL